ncbi:MAG: hypothetical protein K9L59_16395 [Desulfobacterales bacterium]|nr:hypothetical protein [Desulfobacterales bacterium]
MEKKTPDKSDDSSPSFERFVIPSVLLMLLLIVIYGNSFHAPFQFDDFINIVDNPNVQSRGFSLEDFAASFHGRDSGRSGISRPVAYLTLAANHSLGGLDPFGYHVVNFAVHALSALLLFFFTYRILCWSAFGKTRSRESLLSIALLSAALWASHPIQVTAVTYIVQRMAAMAGLFTLLAMFSYVEARTAESRLSVGIYTAVCLIFGALAVGSKENAAMLPVNLVLLEIFVVGGRGGKSRRFNVYLFGLAAFLVLFAGLWFTDIGKILAGYENRPFTLGERLLTEPRVFVFYISQLFYPVSQRFTMLHDVEVSTGLLTPWTTLPAILLTTALPICAWFLRKRWPLVSFSILFFWVNHLIEGTIIPLEIIFEHRNYLPSMFFFLPVAMVFVHLLEKYSLRHFLPVSAIVFLTIFMAAQGHTVYLRNELFGHPILLWQDNVAKAPALHRPRHNLGNAQMIYGNPEKGFNLLLASMPAKASARIDQKFKTHYNMGLYHLSQKEAALAEERFREALKLFPGNKKAIFGLASTMILERKYPEAERYIFKILRAFPAHQEALVALSWIQLRQGKIQAAKSLAVSAVKAAPKSRLPFFVIGEAIRMEGNKKGALHFYEMYRSDFPEDLNVLIAMIEIQAGLGLEARLERTVSELYGKAGERINVVLKEYDHFYNCLGPWRTEQVRNTISDTICGQLQKVE